MGSHTPGHKRRSSNLVTGAVCGRSALLSAVFGASLVVSLLWLLGFTGSHSAPGKVQLYGDVLRHPDVDTSHESYADEKEARPDQAAYVAKRKYNVAVTERWNDHDEGRPIWRRCSPIVGLTDCVSDARRSLGIYSLCIQPDA